MLIVLVVGALVEVGGGVVAVVMLLLLVSMDVFVLWDGDGGEDM